jgi:hypothetical protein
MSDYCRKMKSTVDGLRHLVFTVPKHILVLNVPQGLPNAMRPCGRCSRTSSRHPPSCRPVMPPPWRSSPRATTHLPRPRLHPLPLAHSSLPHHRPPPRRRPLSLVLLPLGRAGVGGVGPPRPLRTRWWGSWGSWDAHISSDPWSGRISMWPH